MTVLITAVGVQDRDGARPLLWNLRKAFPSVRLTWAKTKLKPKLTLQVVKRPDDQHRRLRTCTGVTRNVVTGTRTGIRPHDTPQK